MFNPSGKESSSESSKGCFCNVNEKYYGTISGASILGGMGGTRPPQFLDWGDEYLIVPPPFFSYVQ